MIITRTPFRVSFVGGGSDMKDFYTQNGYGAVISASIKKYMYIVIHPYFHDKIRIKYSKTEDVEHVEDIEHPIVRECLKKVEIERGIEIASFADVSAGTGLGSSSSFTVGLLHALYAYKGKIVSKEQLAQEACEIEIDILKEPIGKQDQYAAAYGGVNHLKFNKDETVEVTPQLITSEMKHAFGTSFCLYFTGISRSAKDILNQQKKNLADEQRFNQLKNLLNLVEEFRTNLKEENIHKLGDILHRGWLYKKKIADPISNSIIDELYQKAIENGASGGKLLGAGGGGFLLLYAENHDLLKNKLGCRVLPFHLDQEGTKILFYE